MLRVRGAAGTGRCQVNERQLELARRHIAKLGGLVRDGVKAGVEEVAIHHVADRAIAGRCHPNRHTGHDNLGDWRVDYPLAPELAEEAAFIAEQTAPDNLHIEETTTVAPPFF